MASTPSAPVAAVSTSRCNPLPAAQFTARKRDLDTALSSQSLSPERGEALQLELRYIVDEEQYDQMPEALKPVRADSTTRVTSIDGRTRHDALMALRQVFKLGYDWDFVKDPAAGRNTWLCRSITSGVYAPDVHCQCKPQNGARWGNK